MLKKIKKHQENFVKDHCSWLNPESNKDIVGSQQTAKETLDQINPELYCRTRNYLNGAITKLSPFIRHGIITLNEVRNTALKNVDDPKKIEKFIQELAWRDFWQRLYKSDPTIIWNDIEPYKTGFSATDYKNELPEDIKTATTKNHVINQFIKILKSTGYLHNHARMYLASYIVHFRRIKWQVGAKWMHHYLIDGDLASNNLSWQWVASTFSHKPYIFNLDNVKKYADSTYDVSAKNNPELDYDYPTLSLRLFPNIGAQQ